MTLDEFFRKLRETPRNWEIGPAGAIRQKMCCPLEIVAGTGPGSFWRAGRKLGLPTALVDEIVEAADEDENHDPKLRARLLRACGLKEKP